MPHKSWSIPDKPLCSFYRGWWSPSQAPMQNHILFLQDRFPPWQPWHWCHLVIMSAHFYSKKAPSHSLNPPVPFLPSQSGNRTNCYSDSARKQLLRLQWRQPLQQRSLKQSTESVFSFYGVPLLFSSGFLFLLTMYLWMLHLSKELSDNLPPKQNNHLPFVLHGRIPNNINSLLLTQLHTLHISYETLSISTNLILCPDFPRNCS